MGAFQIVAGWWTPTGAFRRGRCLHRPREATQSDNLECTHQNIG